MLSTQRSIDSNASAVKPFSLENTRDSLVQTAVSRGSHARGMHPTQDTSRMGTARVKQEEEADTRIIVRNIEERKGEGSQQGITSANDLTIELYELRESLYHISD